MSKHRTYLEYLIEKVGSGTAAIHHAMFTRFVHDTPSSKRLQILVNEQKWYTQAELEAEREQPQPKALLCVCQLQMVAFSLLKIPKQKLEKNNRKKKKKKTER